MFRLVNRRWRRPTARRRVYITCDSAAFSPDTVRSLIAPLIDAEPPYKHLPIVVADLDDAFVERIGSLPELYVQESDDPVYPRVLRSMDRMLDSGEPQTVNVSLAPPGYPFHPREALNVATRRLAEAGHVVVFAAGNGGPPEGTLSPWSVAPWVIGVGAANDDGSGLLPISSVGSKGSLLYQPTVVAPGRTVVPIRDPCTAHATMVTLVLIGKEGGGRNLQGHQDIEFVGTSVSAPRIARVCGELMLLLRLVLSSAWLLHSRASGSGEVSRVEDACAIILASQNISAPDIPFLDGVSSAALRPMLQMLTVYSRLGLPLEPMQAWRDDDMPFPLNLVKRMLQAMARPMPGHASHQVGAGFVNDKIAREFLAKLAPETFLSVLLGDAVAVSASDFAAMDRRLLPDATLALIAERQKQTQFTGFKVL